MVIYMYIECILLIYYTYFLHCYELVSKSKKITSQRAQPASGAFLVAGFVTAFFVRVAAWVCIQSS